LRSLFSPCTHSFLSKLGRHNTEGGTVWKIQNEEKKKVAEQQKKKKEGNERTISGISASLAKHTYGKNFPPQSKKKNPQKKKKKKRTNTEPACFPDKKIWQTDSFYTFNTTMTIQRIIWPTCFCLAPG
jgi:hypothetical protein